MKGIYYSLNKLLHALAGFAPYMFVSIAHTLTLIGFRRIISPDISSKLADCMLIDALNGNFCVLFNGNFNAFRNRMSQGVGEAKGQIKLFSFNRCSKSNTVNL